MMHKKSNAVLSFLLMLVLLAASISIGAYKGWSEKKAEVEQSMGSLFEMLIARREIGSNILSVAKRHLDSDDEMMKSLQKDIADLAKNSSFSDLAKANERFDHDAAALLSHLSSQPSIQTDDRDLMYIEQMLPQALEKSARMTEQAEYNQQALTFNQDMNKSYSGRIAQLLGVKPAEQFIDLEASK